MSTHEPRDAVAVADRVLFLDKGRVVATLPRPFDANDLEGRLVRAG